MFLDVFLLEHLIKQPISNTPDLEKLKLVCILISNELSKYQRWFLQSLELKFFIHSFSLKSDLSQEMDSSQNPFPS
jgi:hypothetical protein